MKTKITSLIMALLVFGCASVSNVNVWAADAHDAAYFGTKVALIEVPSSRTKLEKVRDGLDVLLAKPDPLTIDSLLLVLAELPVYELKSQRAQLYIFSGRLVLRRAGAALEVGDISTLRPIVQGIRDGIDSGLK